MLFNDFCFQPTFIHEYVLCDLFVVVVFFFKCFLLVEVSYESLMNGKGQGVNRYDDNFHFAIIQNLRKIYIKNH